MPEIQEGLTYVIGEHPSVKDDWAVVHLLKEPYKDILVKFGDVGFGSENPDGTIACTFNYDIIEDAGHLLKDLEVDVAFNNLLGDIAIDIISTNLDTAFKDKDEDGTDIYENRTENIEVPD